MTHAKGTDCRWCRESIEPWLDGDLDDTEALRFEEHVVGCVGCASRIELARSVHAALRSLPQHECPASVVERALAAFGAAHPSLRSRIARWWAPRVEVFLRPAMVAMVLVVVAAGVFVVANRDRLDGSPGGSYSPAEVEHAAREARLAFAYVGYYARRSGNVVRKDVMADRVVPLVADAVADSREQVIDRTLVPKVEEAVLNALFVETIPRINRLKR